MRQAKLKGLTEDLLAFPPDERAVLAQELWGSLDGSETNLTEDQFLDEAERRNQEMKSGAVACRTHEEVMASLRSRFR